MKVKDLYRIILDDLKKADIESPDSEARILLCESLDMTSTELLLNTEKEMKNEDEFKALEMCKRRIEGEPLQYIIGNWDFYGRTFKVGQGVLIPRPETELLCSEAVEKLKNKKNAVVYDLCSGSGCIGITLKNECPDIKLYMIEKSDDAFTYLSYNIKNLCGYNESVHIIKGDVLDIDSFRYLPSADIIVSNPPYIKSQEVPVLQKEVTFEPEMALDGGSDGLIFYRYIINFWSEKLKSDGEILFEIGEDQGNDVSSLFKKKNFDTCVIKDYNNHDRIVIGRKVSDDI